MPRILNLLSLLGLSSNFGVLMMFWNELPERVPIHCGAAGNSLIAITQENAGRQKDLTLMLTSWVTVEIFMMFVIIEGQSIQVAMGRADGLGGQFLPIVLAVVFGTIGYYIWRGYQLR